MTGATLFSGIHSAEAAMPRVQWLWCAEIEEFPAAVGSYRHPFIPNLGDVTAPDFVERARGHGPIDLLVFGSPCQAFSVAGKRLGLDDPRGNLALVALGIIAALRPRWFTFENVPGLLSSGRGRDLGAFFGQVEDIGYSGAWRVLDAAHFGVPQRRRRFFFVGHSRDWRAAAAVLLEPEGVPRGHKTRREKRPPVAPSINASSRLRRFWESLVAAFGEGEEGVAARRTVEIRGGIDLRNSSLTGEEAQTLQTKANGGQSLHYQPAVFTQQRQGEYAAGLDVASSAKTRDYKDATDLVIPVPQTPERPDDWTPELADPISAHEQRTYSHEGANNFRLRNVVPVAFQERTREGGANLESQEDIAYSLNNPGAGGRRQEMNVAIPILEPGCRTGPSSAEPKAGMGVGDDGDPMFTLQADRMHAVAVNFRGREGGAQAEMGGDQATALRCAGGTSSTPHALVTGGQVRDKAGDRTRGLNVDPAPPSAYGIYDEQTPKIGEDVMPTLRSRDTAGGPMQFVAFSASDHGQDAAEDVAPTLRAMPHDQSHANGGGQAAVAEPDWSYRYDPTGRIPGAAPMAVRRLTPLEAARLQGFPDLWCHIPWKRRKISYAEARYYSRHGVKVWREGERWYTDAPCDGPIYRAFGNAMAVPVMTWIGDRILAVDELLEGR